MATVVLGAQWGDEGKGKLVDILCDDIDVCARCQGGNNAGHTIVVNGVKYDFHMLPSGLINDKCVNLVGSGVVVHTPSLFKELETIQAKGLNTDGRLFVSDRAHLVFDFHQLVDGLREQELSGSKKAIGTTGKGIGPTYSTKATRSGLRVHHLVSELPGAWDEFVKSYHKLLESEQKRFGGFEYDGEAELARYKEYAERLRPMVIDSVPFMAEMLTDKSKKVLVEGANALMLDLDFGTYPYVTSSNTGIGGVSTGLGIPPQKIKEVIGVVKAYTTRVGAGPFPTELHDKTGEYLQEVGAEFGVTTGRRRRCGWLDLVVVKYSTLINGYTKLNITKLDVLDQLPEIKVAVAYKHNNKTLESFPADLSIAADAEVQYKTFKGWQQDTSKCRSYDELPSAAKEYLTFIEDFVKVPISWVGVGAGREAMLTK
ncbi:Adenylosuccinate synthetase [Wickerhamiella sorbophila]|uniref:Adenylosuccinate synthetase n=1 Tax=Wickerhamiella sorbophila TaxID=45607 RepID=A0A2T0FG33_9ASCO|nr:Adenylosuccinate synthetase [Wickerhamiella sorbophila]PRT53919.1 Adenylosuccinate synthetase [Wickerhamiella sorbophila]